jgi:Domain of unknown function (DUF5671)
MSQDLQSFVREALRHGISREAIRAELAKAGWPAAEVESALRGWAESDLPIPVPRRRPYLSARETFLYLVQFVTLYTTAFNVGAVLFQFVERWLPDRALGGGGDRFSAAAVRNAVAALLIAFPVFLVIARMIARGLRRDPQQRGSLIRKWLTYVTLFLAALVIIGDLTTLVARALSGELAPRFLLKVAAVLVIAGAAFGHFLGDLRQDEEEGVARVPGRPSFGLRLGFVAVLLVIAGGLVLSGSPGHERLRQLDAQRVGDLVSLSAAINAYRHDQLALPDSLPQLLASAEPGRPGSMRDPVSGRLYEYRALDSLRYELCAEFAIADSLTGRFAPQDQGSEFWRHGPGHTCFTFHAPRTALR